MAEEELKLDELMNWTDEECDNYDKERHIHLKNIRDLVKQLNDLSIAYQNLLNESNQLKGFLARGEVMGYTIHCPNCKVPYNVSPQDLNYNKEITCQDCGEKYIQNENIFGIFLREALKEND